ncbi:sacsin N-terminal ATP-binding-like domain-containing protein, partial [Frankia sp. AgB1.8]|uniref:sacsin N-terminal ATP-binding-like domain-containing protein n=1 Tax=Frankia sp. AgB1.8 TaxID=2792839 RepID=UPI0035A89835
MEATHLDAIDGAGPAGPDLPAGQADPLDPFGTAAIRSRVLDAWAASPARFREDANAEEDAALGAYRDRLVAELLQNGVDAAAAAGVPGRVLIRLAGDLLEVANTGSPLTAEGVEALSTLRASAKRDVAAVGRFGAGFAAVLAVSDDPSVVSRDPRNPEAARGVRWSKDWTATAVHEIGAAGLRTELGRREGAAPVLRLPFAASAPPRPPAGYDTVVRLPLRDADAVATAHDLLAAFDPTLLVVLPGLSEVVLEIDGQLRTHSCAWEYVGAGEPGSELSAAVLEARGGELGADVDSGPVETPLDARLEIALLNGERWRGCVRRGTIPAGLLADRPVEERTRTGYVARVMVRDGGWPTGVPKVVRAPQPTDEALSLPVLASVELPLEPSRRHTVAGPLRDWLTDRLAEAVVALAIHLGTAGSTDDPAGFAGPEGNGADGADDDLFAAFAATSGTTRGDAAAVPGADPLVPPDPLAALELVPAGLPAGAVDGRLRDAVAALLPEAALLPGGRLGRECVVCDLGPATDAVTALLAGPHPLGRVDAAHRTDHGVASSPDLVDAEFDSGFGVAVELGGKTDDPAAAAVAGLLPARYAARHWRRALDALGVRRLDSAGLVEVLAGLRRRAPRGRGPRARGGRERGGRGRGGRGRGRRRRPSRPGRRCHGPGQP